ncbi:MAG: processive 1,2-diacylglycerol beta-glucosyltransferase [Acidobacteriota bacterium]|jgi:UDP-N-acetylglucosamine:LPS N-acetylglucosamine transferase|nr:processive 1,2-diacylglycerol beta-glucosyltransferase [Acidobacteriota bacterium]MDT7806833.1 processive 1,2-diacylglycerol beta-glucosyltransferase [Acidobacteriota bacterium]
MFRARVPKILIISSDTGGGHKSAAAAIVAGVQKFFESDSYAVRVVKAVEESHRLSARMVAFYNWVLRNRQHWMKYLYWGINRFRPETREFFYRRSVGFIRDLFERWCPHVVVSVHPLTQHALARVLKELGLADKVPLVTVVTDPCYGFWKGWACDDVTLYLVASDEAKQQLIDYGVRPERIKVSGMPVHPKFELPNERTAQAARRELGLDPQKFTVFVNAGWVGGGNIPQIFRELVRGELDVQAIFLAGRNEELRTEAESLAASAKFPVKVIGYSEQVEQLMQAANVMVSKLGGLTTFEALACRVPIIADATTPPMPQESGAATMLVKRGAGVLLKRAADIVPVVRRMVEDLPYYSGLRAATAGMAFPDSTRRIVEEITALIPAPLLAEEEPTPFEIRSA